jgi:anti-anti-sigma regulatory factor
VEASTPVRPIHRDEPGSHDRYFARKATQMTIPPDELDRTVTASQVLHLTRLPGAIGPILRCSGELTRSTMGALNEVLAELAPLGHAALTVNVSDCTFLDPHGILSILQVFKRLRGDGQRLVVVASEGFAGLLLRRLGFDHIVPMFPTEEAAELALRGGLPFSTPATWEEARAETVCHWEAVLGLLDHAPPKQILHRLTSTTALCERSDEIMRLRSMALVDSPSDSASVMGQPSSTGSAGAAVVPPPERWASSRCAFCPLFTHLGGGPNAIGCQCILDPMTDAVRSGNRRSARSQAAAVVQMLETMPLPGDWDLPR